MDRLRSTPWIVAFLLFAWFAYKGVTAFGEFFDNAQKSLTLESRQASTRK